MATKYIDIYEEHLQFLWDSYKLIVDNLWDEDKENPNITKKLDRIKSKIWELNELIETEKKKLDSSQN